MVEGVLEALQGVVLLAGDGDGGGGGGLVLGGVHPDLVLERVVVDVVQAPARHRRLLDSLSEFHRGPVRIVVCQTLGSLLPPRRRIDG